MYFLLYPAITVHARRRAIARARLHLRAKSPARAKYRLCQHHYQPCNHTCPNRTLVAVTFCFHTSALPRFILNEAFELLQRQEIRYFRYKNLGSLVQFKIIKSNRSCRQGAHAHCRSCANFFRA